MKLKTRPKASSPEKPKLGLKIISGFQRGVDIAAIRAAKEYGLETGGYVPLGFITLDGMKPEYKGLGAVEVDMGGPKGYRTRTQANVQNSDGTLRIAYDWKSPGELCTATALNQFGKNCFNVDVRSIKNRDTERMILYNVVKWIRDQGIKVLNVAGNADEHLEPFVEKFMLELFKELESKL